MDAQGAPAPAPGTPEGDTPEAARQRVLDSVEDSKKMLSKLKKVTDTVGNHTNGIARIELSREVFEMAVDSTKGR